MANATGNADISDYSPTTRGAYNPDDVAAALADSFGIATVAAKKLGCSAQTVRLYVQRYAVCRDAQNEGRQLLADHAEVSLVRKVKDDEQWAVKMALHAHGADRGYVPEAGMVAAETARAVIEAVGALVRMHVKDRDALVAIFSGINELAGQEVMRVPTIESGDARESDVVLDDAEILQAESVVSQGDTTGERG